jgi:CRISPR/Cas system-associated exonuclease Cas4 (RecB family)
MEDAKGGGILNFTTELLQEFEDHLKQKISEIIVGAEPFMQTEDEDKCEYCAYASICNVN